MPGIWVRKNRYLYDTVKYYFDSQNRGRPCHHANAHIKVYETDLEQVELVNALSRELCSAPMDVAQFEERIAVIRQNKRYSLWVLYPAYTLHGAVFTMFFGDNISDAAASAVCAVLIYFLLRMGRRIELHSMILTISCAAIGGLSPFY